MGHAVQRQSRDTKVDRSIVTELAINGGPKQAATRFCPKHRSELIKPGDARCAVGRKRGANCR